jgi:hypothetical protein
MWSELFVVREESVSEWFSAAAQHRGAWGAPGFSAGISTAGAAQVGGSVGVGSSAVDFASATFAAASNIHADEPVEKPAPGFHDGSLYPEMDMEADHRKRHEEVAREQQDEQEPHHYSACLAEGAVLIE